MAHSTGRNLISQNRVFVWIAIATAGILLIPLIAMQFTQEVQWDGIDFIVMGLLLFGLSSLCVLVSRRVASKRRWLVVGLFAMAFLFVWAELAVGIFTDLGS